MTELLVYKNGEKEYKIKIAEGGEPSVSYQVVNKYDADALDGYQKLRTTKVPDPLVNNWTSLGIYDSHKGIYDTAMTKDSYVLSKLFPDVENRQRAITAITKHILNPLIEMKGKDTVDNPQNFTFWDDFGVHLSEDLVFNTTDRLQRAQLFFLIAQGKLAPKEFESDPWFKDNAQYSVENKDSVINVSQQRDFEKNKAVARFMNLLDTDKKGLEAILDWMGVPGLVSADDELMNSIFTHWLSKDDNQNPQKFLSVYDNYYKSPAGKVTLDVFKNLKDLEKDKKVTRKANGIFLGEDFLGENFKAASENLAKDKDLLKKIYDVLEAV